jgi:predicted phage tail component-like protein
MSLVAYIASLPKSNCEVSMNGTYFCETIPGFKTNKVEGRDKLKFDITSLEIGNSAGSRYRYKKDAAREITVSFGLFADSKEEFLKKDNVFKGLIRNAEDAHWVFDDEPGIYFIGTVSAIDFDMLDSTSSEGAGGTGSITIECYDPYKYSTTVTTVTNNGGNTIGLVNNGTVPTPLSAEIVFQKTAGFASLALGERYYQIGSLDDIQTASSKKASVTLFDDVMGSNNGWLANCGIIPQKIVCKEDNKQEGTMRFVPPGTQGMGGVGDGYCCASNYGDDAANYEGWHGPSITKMVPADSSSNYPVNWRVCWTYDFNNDYAPDGPGRTGSQEMSLVDQDGEIIIGTTIIDCSGSANSSSIHIQMGNNRVYQWDTDARFYLSGHPSSTYNVWIEKIGNQITVSWPYVGFTKTFTAYKASAQLRQVTWWCSQFKNNAQMCNNLLRRASCTMHYSDTAAGIPNYFQAGDVVTFNSTTDKTTVDGIPNWDRVDVGSQPLLLEPGTHTLGINQTTGSTVPKVTISYNERWL